MSDFSVLETPDPHPYHKAYRELWVKGWVAAMGDSFVVYETLRMHANHKTGLCYPKQSTLLAETGIKSVNTLRKRIDHLIALGVVQISKEPTPNTPTEYRVITAPYLPFYSEDQNLTPERGSKFDTREDQNLIVRGSKFDTREDQNLIPNKKKRTKLNNKTYVTSGVTENCTEHSDRLIVQSPPLPVMELKEEKAKIQREAPPSAAAKRSTDMGSLMGKRTDHRAIAEAHSVKKSAFTSVEECDDFYAYLFQRFRQEPRVSSPQAEIYANAICKRLTSGESQPKDRQYLKEFRGGLERVSRGEEIHLQVLEALQS